MFNISAHRLHRLHGLNARAKAGDCLDIKKPGKETLPGCSLGLAKKLVASNLD